MLIEWKRPASSPFFLVSSAGSVMVTDTGEKAAIRDNGNGYKQVQIMRGGKRYTRYVHRLVAECFLENPRNLPEVNHKDGNKENNAVENLEWVTRSENMLHSYRTGLKPHTTPRQQAAARENGKKANVQQAKKDGWLKWSKTEAARECWLKNLSKARRKNNE